MAKEVWREDKETIYLPGDDYPTDLNAWLKNELRKGLHKELLISCWGPAIYGPGNFEVYENEQGEWRMRPVKDFKPAEIKGIQSVVMEVDEITHWGDKEDWQGLTDG